MSNRDAIVVGLASECINEEPSQLVIGRGGFLATVGFLKSHRWSASDDSHRDLLREKIFRKLGVLSLLTPV